MEEIKKPISAELIVEKLKANDPQAEALVRNYKAELLGKHLSKNWEVYADLGKVYEEAGLLEKAKNFYYNAYAYAEKSAEFERAKELLEKSLSLPGEIDD